MTALSTIVLTACVNINVSAPTDASTPPSVASSASEGADHSMHGDMMNDTDIDADTHFLQMMIPHHEQAVEMSALASTNGASAQVQDLAEQIAGAQGPEIEQMRAWLDEAGEPVGSGMDMAAGHDMGAHHDMAMDGMLTDEEMSALRAATGPEFDRLYLTFMTAHHEGAIVMAEHVRQAGDDPRVAELAQAIITAQQAEITQMKQMLAESS